jgi:hypothetical protein
VGETGRTFRARYNEHSKYYIRDNTGNEKTANLIVRTLNNGHSFDNMENALQIPNIKEKGPYLNRLEAFHINKN